MLCVCVCAHARERAHAWRPEDIECSALPLYPTPLRRGSESRFVAVRFLNTLVFAPHPALGLQACGATPDFYAGGGYLTHITLAQ